METTAWIRTRGRFAGPRHSIRRLSWKALSVALSAMTALASLAPALAAGPSETKTPIEHLIVIIGENHTFDNLFGVYAPAGDQTVANLLSKGNRQRRRDAGTELRPGRPAAGA